MIPYFEQPSLDVGIGTIHAFGVLVATAFLLGLWRAAIRAERTGLDYQRVMDFGTWLFFGSFIMAHWAHVFIYHPEELDKDPWVVIKFWQGLSSYGGFAGALGIFIFYFKRLKQPLLAYADALAFAFPIAWAIGRTGCTVAFDHKGALTDFIFAMQTHTGEVRHNLGLYEALYSYGLALVFWLLGRKARPVGFFAALFAILYAPVRFALDSLRATDLAFGDRRILGLTPAQYGCILLLGFGIWVMVQAYKGKGQEAKDFLLAQAAKQKSKSAGAKPRKSKKK